MPLPFPLYFRLKEVALHLVNFKTIILRLFHTRTVCSIDNTLYVFIYDESHPESLSLGSGYYVFPSIVSVIICYFENMTGQWYLLFTDQRVTSR